MDSELTLALTASHPKCSWLGSPIELAQCALRIGSSDRLSRLNSPLERGFLLHWGHLFAKEWIWGYERSHSMAETTAILDLWPRNRPLGYVPLDDNKRCLYAKVNCVHNVLNNSAKLDETPIKCKLVKCSRQMGWIDSEFLIRFSEFRWFMLTLHAQNEV